MQNRKAFTNTNTTDGKDSLHHSSETATGRQSPNMATNASTEEHLKQLKRTDSIYMSPEIFEKLYLAPENKVKGDLRGTFANPTGLFVITTASFRTRSIANDIRRALLGLVMSIFPFSCDIMG